MRLGDLDALKEHAQKLLVGESINTYFGINLYKMFEEIIDNAPTVTNGTYEQGFRVGAYGRLDDIRPQGEWTPVSERLPKQANRSYLVTVDYGDGLTCSCQRFFFGEGIGWNDDSVIAWQPLPKPYKKDRADMRSNMEETTFDDYLKEQLKDPEFREEWENLCDEDIQEGDKG